MDNWDRNLGLMLLVLGVVVLAYGMFIYGWIDSTHPYTDLKTIHDYVGVISAVGVILMILGVFEVVHGLPKRPSERPSPMETDE